MGRAGGPWEPTSKGPKTPRGPELTPRRRISGAIVVAVVAVAVVAQQAVELLLLMVLLRAALYGIRSVEISASAASQMRPGEESEIRAQ